MRRRRSLAAWSPFAISAAVLLVVWEVAGRVEHVYFLPPASRVAVAFWELIVDGTLVGALAVSLATLLVGVTLAVILGTLFGAVLALSERAQAALDPFVNAAMSAPLVAFVPLFILVFGLGYPTRLTAVTLFALFPVIVNIAAGLRAADVTLIEMGRSFGAEGRVLFWVVRLPLAFPYVRAALSVAMARGVDGLIAGEALIASVGLGAIVAQYANAFSIEKLYAVALFIIVLALVAVQLVDRAGRALLRQEAAR